MCFVKSTSLSLPWYQIYVLNLFIYGSLVCFQNWLGILDKVFKIREEVSLVFMLTLLFCSKRLSVKNEFLLPALDLNRSH